MFNVLIYIEYEFPDFGIIEEVYVNCGFEVFPFCSRSVFYVLVGIMFVSHMYIFAS